MEAEKAVSPSNGKLIGLLLSVLGIAVFSTIELNCKWLARTLAAAGATPIDGFSLCFQRFFWTGLILIGMFYPAYRRSGRRLAARDLGVFLLNGVVCVTISISLYQFAVSIFENASSAAVVFSSNALFTIIFARFINQEPWTFRKWLAIVIGMAGICCFVFEKGTPTMSTLGAILLMWGSALAFACSVCMWGFRIGGTAICLHFLHLGLPAAWVCMLLNNMSLLLFFRIYWNKKKRSVCE